jgi:hypothetical protein
MGRGRLARFIQPALFAASLIILLLGSSSPIPVAAQDISPTPSETPTETPTEAPTVTETPLFAPSATPYPPIAITSPGTQRVFGTVEIRGISLIENFSSAEVAFAYQDNPTGTWFLIQQSQTPVTNGVLALWDTTAITDGFYNLRLRITLTDGTTKDVTVSGVEVRNYTATETPLPTGTALPTATLIPILPTNTPSITPSPYPTPTALPANPAELNQQSLLKYLAYGAGGVIVAFAFFALVLTFRRK